MDANERQKLWDEYSRKMTPQLREQIIIEYANLVKVVAGKLSIHLGYNVEYDDLVGFGTFGLVDAVDKFDQAKGVKFETYASLRIRGAMLDQVRKMDWIPRTLRQKQKKLDAAYQKIEEMSGELPTDELVAKELHISLEELELLKNQTQVSSLISLDQFIELGETRQEPVDPDGRFQPERIFEQKELKSILMKALELLTEKEKKVILLYYYEELTLKEISAVLEVSESRISQLHTKALQKMRVKLGNHIQIFMGM